ncbi:MAG TPA: glycosyltransferase family 2 protein [Candidatus Limnocylindria bacterium]|nr:glycosyltransferase family 2 protein [Candidatus Limnocylindria bacterium]
MSSGRGADTLVIIPAYNEERHIGPVVRGVRAALPQAGVLVIDDGSRDRTRHEAHAAGARVVSHVFNLGYGAALQTGYKYADRGGYRYVVQLDADGQHPPDSLPRLLAPLEAGTADVVIGSRFVEASDYRMGRTRTLGRKILGRLLVVLGGPRVADPTSGLQALARPAFRLCCGDFYPTDFPDIDVLLFLHREGLRLTEVPVAMAPSPPGKVALHGGLRDVYYMYKMLLSTFRSRLGPRPRGGRDAVVAPSSHEEVPS